jgi:hypothetical protein
MASLIRASVIACATIAGLGLAGCANDGSLSSMFATNSIGASTDTAAAAITPKIDPVCGTLASQIDGLRKEGTIDRLEKVADGKGANVQVQRTALKKQAELNKANADYLAKCAPNMPKTAAMAPALIAAPAAAAPIAAAAKIMPAAKAAAAIAPTGVTVAAPEVPKVQ